MHLAAFGFAEILDEIMLKALLWSAPSFPRSIRAGGIDLARWAVHSQINGFAIFVEGWGHVASSHELPIGPVHLK